jgi:alpha-1,6-mannosyltransferase
MRIVRLANFVMPRSGGLRTALRELGKGYAAAGHEPVLVIPGPDHSDELTDQGRVIALPAPLVPGMGGYRLLLNKRAVSRVLRDLKPDRIEVSDRTTLRWTGRWARREGVPSVMVSHESLDGLLPLASLSARLNRATARHYDRVICTTAWAAAEFERIGAGNVTEVPLGVDLELFHPSRNDSALRAGLARPDELLLVCCTRLSVEKRPARALRTLETMLTDGVAARLVMAGDGPLRRRLEADAEAAGLPVTFTGFLSDRAAVAGLLATADLVIAPGPVETFGLAALEALACGTPTVVSSSSALPAVIGQAGVAVAGEDLSSGVHALLRKPAVQRRAASRARAQAFGWDAAVSGFLAVHESLQ